MKDNFRKMLTMILRHIQKLKKNTSLVIFLVRYILGIFRRRNMHVKL